MGVNNLPEVITRNGQQLNMQPLITVQRLNRYTTEPHSGK